MVRYVLSVRWYANVQTPVRELARKILSMSGSLGELSEELMTYWFPVKWQCRGLLVSIALYLNLHLSFLNLISRLLVSSSYPIVLVRLGAPCSRTIYRV